MNFETLATTFVQTQEPFQLDVREASRRDAMRLLADVTSIFDASPSASFHLPMEEEVVTAGRHGDPICVGE